jgi:hypothetical protein
MVSRVVADERAIVGAAGRVAAMNKFKVGDRVRVATEKYGKDQLGDTGITEYVSAYGSLPVRVKFDADCHAKFNSYNHEDLVLIAAVPAPKFKVGDRVIRANGYFPGDIGVVTHLNDSSFTVEWAGTHGNSPNWEAYELTKVTDSEPTTTQHIVASIKNGKPAPSYSPFVHASAEAATAEAERLAQKHPGDEFAVFARVAGRVADVTVTMREVA